MIRHHDRRRARAAERDAAIREAETKAYAARGLAPTTSTVEVDTGYGRSEVRLTEVGSDRGGDPVLLLHGVASITVLGAPLLAGLEGRRVIAVDWPGHGLSGPCVLPPGASLRTHATTVLRSLTDTLGIDRFDLVGHSLGAQFSLYAALDLRARVRRVVLLGAPGAAFDGVQPVAAMKLLAVPRLGPLVLSIPLSPAMFKRSNDEMLGADAIEHLGADLGSAAYLLAGRVANAASIASFFRALLKRGKVRAGLALTEDELGEIEAPVLVVWGDGDSFMAPHTAARSIVSLRDARLLRLAGAGHAPWLQSEAVTARAVGAHLA